VTSSRGRPRPDSVAPQADRLVMTQETNAAETVERRARHSDLLDWLVRAGLVAYGVLHLLLAWVSVRLVAGHHGSPSQGGAPGRPPGRGRSPSSPVTRWDGSC
jgi:hypothetical protein